jgi:hypothetical protein
VIAVPAAQGGGAGVGKKIVTSTSGVRPSSDAATNELRTAVTKNEAFAQRVEPGPDVSKIFKRLAGWTWLRPRTGALRSITEPAVRGGVSDRGSSGSKRRR